MSSARNFLRVQSLELSRLLDLAQSDAVMEFALRQRKEDFDREAVEAPAGALKPRTVLFFSGGPVQGSQGIDAQFAAETLKPFLEMVKTQYSAQKHGQVGARGPRRGESEARLLLTGLPRGSFGLELSQPQIEDFLVAEQLSDTLVRLTEVISAAADTDERFAVSLDRISPRVLPRLQDFLGVIANHGATLRVESGDLSVDLPVERVLLAQERVATTRTDDTVLNNVQGVFRGATLDSLRFDFRQNDGSTISGRIADEVGEPEAAEFVAMTGHSVSAQLREISVRTPGGNLRKRYELLRLDRVPELPRG